MDSREELVVIGDERFHEKIFGVSVGQSGSVGSFGPLAYIKGVIYM